MAYLKDEANGILNGLVATFNEKVATINASELDDATKASQISELCEKLKEGFICSFTIGGP